MMLPFFSACWSVLAYLFTTSVRTMLFLTLLYTCCSHMGWIRRLLWFLIEGKLSEIFNNADVTIGSLEINLVEGRLVATNAVIHTPFQQEWKWESPLIARVGRVYVEWNMWSIAYQLWYLGIDPPIADIYTIHLQDIQVFVERQQHVFNVYLLDPAILLPNPAEIVKPDCNPHPRTPDQSPVPDQSRAAAEQDMEREEEQDIHAEQQAQELVNQLFSAVKTIGKKGGWKGAWRAQKESLTSKLRHLQSVTKKTEYMQEGVKVISKVGKAVAKTSNMPTVPQRREREKDDPPLYCRIGRVILRDIRVFTRQEMQWNKPIVLKEIIVRAAELCPPMSSLDDKGHPALYQPIDKLVEVVWKRVLTTMAKSQTGRLLNTAMGEVLGIAMTSIENNTTTSSPVQSTVTSTVLEYRPDS